MCKLPTEFYQIKTITNLVANNARLSESRSVFTQIVEMTTNPSRTFEFIEMSLSAKTDLNVEKEGANCLSFIYVSVSSRWWDWYRLRMVKWDCTTDDYIGPYMV